MDESAGLYDHIPDPPVAMSAGAVLGRLADAVGFRYRWATQGITAADMAIKPTEACLGLGELLSHVLELLSWIAEHIGMQPRYELVKSEEPEVLRAQTLELAAALGARFKSMSDEELSAVKIRSSRGDTLPVWNMVNGPLADSLTHIGQILSWRRIAGSPPAPADVFRGRPPRGQGA